jgi:DegV family protein with EDD domain
LGSDITHWDCPPFRVKLADVLIIVIIGQKWGIRIKVNIFADGSPGNQMKGVTQKNGIGYNSNHSFRVEINLRKGSSMSRIAIITDSDSSLPVDLSTAMGITQVPITIHFDDGSFTTGVDIDDKLVFKKIDERNKLPTTSAPAPGAFVAAYQRAFDQGASSIVCICVSSKVSATYSAAVTACESFSGSDITVIDSLQLSMGQGFMALAAAEAAARGESKQNVIDSAVDTGRRVHLFAVLSTLKYLALSGRVGKFASGIANTLDIKPILTVKEGKLDMLEKIRTQKKATLRMIELTCEAVDGKNIERAAILHVTAEGSAQQFCDQLAKQITLPADVITAEFTPGLSVHAGSGVVGVALVTK